MNLILDLARIINESQFKSKYWILYLQQVMFKFTSKDIHTAAREGDKAAIEAAIARGESVHAKDEVSQIQN